MVKINVLKGNKLIEISAYKGEKLDEVLRRNGISISMPCGGIGKCGKCSIKVIKGNSECSLSDIKAIGQLKCRQGYRLLCQMYAKDDLTIQIEQAQEENGFKIIDSHFEKKRNIIGENGLGICIDLGTTTIVGELINLKNGEIIKKESILNSQRTFGSDVISRISVAENGKAKELKKTILKDILNCIQDLIDNQNIKKEVKKIVIAGNTAMTYLLLGKNCNEIARFPFECSYKDIQKFSFYQIFDSKEFDFDIYIVGCLSAFVGGDIVAGILFSDIDKMKNCLLVDLGTNAEMVIFNGESIFVSSAAAGPSFEGGGISCGVGGINGAISSVWAENGVIKYDTINNDKPIGICGSGLIDLIATLKDENIIDETGLLNEKYFETGFQIAENIILTQKDIREFQLTKSAINSGIRILCNSAGIKLSEVEQVFIGGGFGKAIRVENAIKCGIFPKELSGEIRAIGNSCLGGLEEILTEKLSERLNFLKEKSRGINLAEVNEFQNLFLQEMNF